MQTMEQMLIVLQTLVLLLNWLFHSYRTFLVQANKGKGILGIWENTLIPSLVESLIRHKATDGSLAARLEMGKQLLLSKGNKITSQHLFTSLINISYLVSSTPTVKCYGS